MKQKYLIVFIIVIIVLVGSLWGYFTVYRNKPLRNQPLATSTLLTYNNLSLGISFVYPSTYFVFSEEVGSGGLNYTHKITLLEDTEDARNMITGRFGPSEFPVSISVEQYKATSTKQTLIGSLSNPYLHYSLRVASATPLVVGGEKGFLYTWDGLYRADTIVLMHGMNIYSFTVTYLASEDEIRKDFFEIMKSVSFSS